MNPEATMPLMDLAASGEPVGVPSREGFFWCERCHHVVTLSQREVDLAESAPAGSLLKLKCPACHHHEVRWRFPSVIRPARVQVYSEQGVA